MMLLKFAQFVQNGPKIVASRWALAALLAVVGSGISTPTFSGDAEAEPSGTTATLTSKKVVTETTSSPTVSLDTPTHRQLRTIQPMLEGSPVELRTFVVDREGRILACVNLRNSIKADLKDSDTAVSSATAGVLVMDSQGETLDWWPLEISPCSIAVSPAGDVFVGGDGKVLRLDASGKVQASAPLPHLGDEETFRKNVIASVRESMEMRAERYRDQLESTRQKISEIEEIEEAERTRLQASQLAAFKSRMKIYKSMGITGSTEEIPESRIKSAMKQTLGVTSMAASQDDVYITVSCTPGRYEVWRINHDLEKDSAAMVGKDFSGCCGQMDIKFQGDHLVVSENTKFRVAYYDQDGKRVSHFGKRDSSSKNGFGSCCNPMNACPLPDGTVLTAESSIGHIKKFDQDGNWVAYIGKAEIGGGCKHCALGFDEERDLYFMMKRDDHAICVLGSITENPLSGIEKASAAKSEAFLKSIQGTWSIPESTKSDSDPIAKVKNEKSGLIALIQLLVQQRTGKRTATANQQLPLTKLTIAPDGQLTDLKGLYAAIGSKGTFVPKMDKSDDESGEVPFSIIMNQVERLSGTWKTGETGHATITLRGQEIHLVRRSDPTIENAVVSKQAACSGSSCENTQCEASDCPTKSVASSSFAVAQEKAARTALANAKRNAKASAGLAARKAKIAELPLLHSSASLPSSAWEYKVIAPYELGVNKGEDSKLNELGADGWEFCGLVDAKMIFKRPLPVK